MSLGLNKGISDLLQREDALCIRKDVVSVLVGEGEGVHVLHHDSGTSLSGGMSDALYTGFITFKKFIFKFLQVPLAHSFRLSARHVVTLLHVEHQGEPELRASHRAPARASVLVLVVEHRVESVAIA